jgi:segregation and condensation protein B
MEFDSTATVETVIELDEYGQPIIQSTEDALVNEESISEEISKVEEVTSESEEKSDEQK